MPAPTRSTIARWLAGISSLQRRRQSGPSSSMKKVRNAMMTVPKAVAAMPLTAVSADPACPSSPSAFCPTVAAYPLDDLVLALEESERAVAPGEVVDEARQGRDQLRDLIDERRNEDESEDAEDRHRGDVHRAD